MNTTETKLLEAIEESCKRNMAKNKVLASLTAAQAVYESNLGVSHVSSTNNLYGIPADNQYTGAVWSLETEQLYDTKDDYPGVDVLLKVYDNYDQSIDDWIKYILTTRRSEKGPLKYQNIPGTTDYKKAVKFLIRDDYQRDHLIRHNDPAYESTVISIIEKYELYKWDQAVISGEYTTEPPKTYYVRLSVDDPVIFSDTSLDNAKEIASNNNKAKVFAEDGTIVFNPWEETGVMYRVMLEWNMQTTQIFASKNLIDAKEEAEKHTGYKVFDDNGTVVHDPWVIADAQPDFGNPNVKKSIQQIPGAIVVLNNVPVYRRYKDKNPFRFLTGKFFFFDNKVLDGRVRITNTRNPRVINGKDPSKIIGFVDLNRVV